MAGSAKTRKCAKSASTGSVEALASALGDPSERVSMAAAAALLGFGPVSEPSLLARAARQGPGRDLAVAALGLVGTERSLAWLASLDERGERDRLAALSLQWLRYRGIAPRNTMARRAR